MRGNSLMPTGAREKTVLFLTDPGDALVREFRLALAREFEARYEPSFFFGRLLHAPDTHSSAEWCVAWVGDDNGQTQAWLEHLPSCQQHWLGTDPQEAMRAAHRLIREWDTEALAVQ
jgi:hypothetical protein